MNFNLKHSAGLIIVLALFCQTLSAASFERTEIQVGQYSYEFELPNSSSRVSKRVSSGAREEYSNGSVHVIFQQWPLRAEEVWGGSKVRLLVGQNARWHEAEHNYGLFYSQIFARACAGECTLGLTIESVTIGCTLDDERCLSKRVADARAYADAMRKVLDGGLFADSERRVKQ